jgi:CMP-N-acetylneuraminic acid synthetase
MITYILEAARASNLFDKIHVSTESARIAEIATEFGHRPEFVRPMELADDHTPLMPVLRNVVETFASRGQDFDEVWLLMPCSPLIDASDLRAGADFFTRAGGLSPVMAVSSYPAPTEKAYEKAESGRLKPVHPGLLAVRSQDLRAKYHDAGAFYAFPVKHVLHSTGAGDYSSFVGYVLPRHKAIDIDNEEDWAFAELIFNRVERIKKTAAVND